MSVERSVSAAVARSFLVRRHMLSPARSLPGDRASVLSVVERLGSLQFDPLEVPGARNHDLVLHARIQGYRRGWCEHHLYGPMDERRLFEAYNKSLNILPVDELPYHRAAWERAKARHSQGILGRRKAIAKAILERIATSGTLCTAEASRTHDTVIDGWWATTSEGRAVLEALFATGQVAIAKRDGNRRHYDLPERVLPAQHLGVRVEPTLANRHRVLSRHRAAGLLGDSGSYELWTGGLGTAAERAAHRAALVNDGVLVPVTVEGVRGRRYVLATELPWLDTPEVNVHATVSFIAPLDPLVWDRILVRELFGFDYKWEVYTPEAQRRWGYYVLPLLYGDQLVGRIEPQKRRADTVLRLLSLRWEKGFDPMEAPGFVTAFREALEAYRVFVGADTVVWPRGKIAKALAKAVAG